MAIKFVPNRAVSVAIKVTERLVKAGEFIRAGDVMMSVEKVKEALDMFMSGEAWDKARDIAKNMAPRS